VPRRRVTKKMRRLLATSDRPRYVLPRHKSEKDRLNLLAYAHFAACGSSFLASVTNPTNALDVGCGTGVWAYIFGRRFPDAKVVGYDVYRHLLDDGPPANFEFVQGNVLEGLPFADATFDYVYQRLMVAAYPSMRYPAGVAELVRVAAPEAWVELVEAIPFVEPAGPVFRELWAPFLELGRRADQDVHGLVPERLPRYLEEAGLIDVTQRTVTMPTGTWGAEVGPWQGKVGGWLEDSMRSLLVRMAPAFAKAGMSQERAMELISALLGENGEINKLRCTASFRVAFGRRPPP
jgi:ubiquinone/menaquinone biosynthesis C-methylase UbiE